MEKKNNTSIWQLCAHWAHNKTITIKNPTMNNSNGPWNNYRHEQIKVKNEGFLFWGREGG
jgi:hypothetical protein